VKSSWVISDLFKNSIVKKEMSVVENYWLLRHMRVNRSLISGHCLNIRAYRKFLKKKLL